MPNRYPLWKNILVVLILLMGVIYAVPNLYHPDPAIQITGESGGTEMTQAIEEQAVNALKQANIEIKATEFSKSSILVRLESREQQLAAKDVVQKTLGDDFIVALNLASTTPTWLNSLGAKPMKLGLDLAGGVHFLLEVDTSTMLAKK